jgi:hypothetical protein
MLLTDEGTAEDNIKNLPFSCSLPLDVGRWKNLIALNRALLVDKCRT